MIEPQLILVDEDDRQIGIAGKMSIHKKGLLHRAFSIIIFNSKGELLLQRRAKSKYHSGGLWANTCCSHPRAGETILLAARKRLFEEMGIRCNLKEIFSFLYKVTFKNGLVENEYDHVLIGKNDKTPKPDPNEVEDWRWIEGKALKMEIRKNPQIYAYWFKILVKEMEIRHML